MSIRIEQPAAAVLIDPCIGLLGNFTTISTWSTCVLAGRLSYADFIQPARPGRILLSHLNLRRYICEVFRTTLVGINIRMAHCETRHIPCTY